MTIYDRLLEIQDEMGRVYKDELKIPVTSLVDGVGYCVELNHPDDHHPLPITVQFDNGYEGLFTERGKGHICDKFPSIALGHFDTQLETAQAIAEQAFDVEGV